MATTETPGQPPIFFCDEDSEGRVVCTPYDSTFITTYTKIAATSTAYLTITTSSQISPLPKATDAVPTTVPSPLSPPVEPGWEHPPYYERHTLPWSMIMIIVGALVLGGSLIGLYVWRRRAKSKEPEYPGHQVLGMLVRTSANGEPGGGAATARNGNGGRAVDMIGGVSAMNATSPGGGAANQALSSSTVPTAVPTAVPVAGRIDGVLAGERSGAGKASGGEVGMARYA